MPFFLQTKQIPGLKIFHYSGGVNFATKNIFKSELLRLVEIDLQREIIARTKLAKYLSNVCKNINILVTDLNLLFFRMIWMKIQKMCLIGKFQNYKIKLIQT